MGKIMISAYREETICIPQRHRIIKGKAKATTLSGEGLLTRFGRGDLFGAAAVFGDNKEYISKIVADSDCTVQFIEQEKLSFL
jgi:CRP-like cAMP-binding protein